MRIKLLFKCIVIFTLLLTLLPSQIAFGEETFTSLVVQEKLQVNVDQAEIFDIEDNLVGQLQKSQELTVQKQENGKVYFQWGTDLAYVAADLVTIFEEPSEEEEILYSEKPLSFISPVNPVTVYTDEELTQVLLTIEPNVKYLVESYSEILFKVIIGNKVGFVDVSILDYLIEDEVQQDNEIPTVETPIEEIIVEEPVEVVEETVEVEEDLDTPAVIEGEEEVPKVALFSARSMIAPEVQQVIPFTAADKYFEPTERVTVYDNSTGKLVFVGYLEKGQSFPIASNYGDWHKIKYGNGDGFVWKASTKPSKGTTIKNIDKGSKTTGTTIQAMSILSVYDNSSGALVPFASLNKDVSYPIVGVMGEWYLISIAGRIGYIYAPATKRDFSTSDKYFEPTERVTVYDNSTGKLVFVGYLEKGQSFPIASNYGDWHKIKYGNGDGFVWKASTKPSTGTTIKNVDKGSKTTGTTIQAMSILSVYDNSSGALVPFASLNKDVSYPIVGVMGEWYLISIAGRIGYVYAPATKRDFSASDKYFEPTERVTVYDNSTGTLVFVGYLEKGQSFPIASNYGDWHKIKYAGGDGFVWKASTKPSNGATIKNIDKGSKATGTTIQALSILSVYDNSSGALVPFASLNKDVSYPIVGVMGEWYIISIAGRIGYIYEPATVRDFKTTDKYFIAKENLAIFSSNNSNPTPIGYLSKGQIYPRLNTDNGDFHKIQYSNRNAFVLKVGTNPATNTTLKNENNGKYKTSGQNIVATQDLTVYDNTSGQLVPFAIISKGPEYPIISDFSQEFYMIEIAGRYGFVAKSGINKFTQSAFTLDQVIQKQLALNPPPQTDKYRTQTSYVSTEYIKLDPKDSKKGIVNTTTLNVRESNTTSSNIVGKLKLNDTITILSTKNGWYEFQYGTWKNATQADFLPHIDPTSIPDSSFQNLILSESANTNAAELNAYILIDKGILTGRGQAFIDAAKTHNINEVYLTSHAFLETGNGKSTLANGIYVNSSGKALYDSNGKLITDKSKAPAGAIAVYNMFGIGADDACPETCGAQRAFNEKWFTPEASIIGGAKFISQKYVYSSHNQDTLYKMRWNPENPGVHQYATDMGWASKQATIMEGIYKKITSYTLRFDIIKYK